MARAVFSTAMTDTPPKADTPIEASGAPTGAPAGGAAYQVLARKYRPTDFDELIGQEALVRTLTNAIAAGRVAHAFVLTGVRGIGKTTTARIIARALNCTGPDGTGGPTIKPCGVCDNCTAIAADRHVDVIEMDAASRTGVDDIRDLIEGVRYKPVQARYKVYIIDEVHMLSRHAFNALLKTLEEPPEHVKFVFATTEIRKVPVTVLSRCQRFDLRRLDETVLAEHLAAIAEKEGAKIDPDAIALIARAADGSVRDGLSLLDQVIAQSSDAGGASGGGAVDAAAVRALLGLADRGQILDLFEHLMQGAIVPALDLAAEMYKSGADPAVIVQDLLETTHWLTRLRLDSIAAAGTLAAPGETERAKTMAAALSVPVLGRSWQMLLKGLSEILMAPMPMTALEMLLVRLAHVADLPSPGELVKTLTATGALAPAQPAASGAAPAANQTVTAPQPGRSRAVVNGADADGPPDPAPNALPEMIDPAPNAAPDPIAPDTTAHADPADFEALVGLFRDRREGVLHAHLMRDVHLVHFERGRLEFQPGPDAPRDLAARLTRCLNEWTGRRWMVSVTSDPGAPSLAQDREAEEAARIAKVAENPLVRAVLDGFPGAKIAAVRDLAQGEGAAPGGDDSTGPDEAEPIDEGETT
jgi:DNA polymerase-3 subunit gamma/tau